MMSILDSLNPKQREAASVIDGALLILAGAGSGKTRTITTRLAYLVQEIGIPPSQTLTLTFTNRAASEMRYRALAMIPHSVETPLLCTFHRFGLLFLRFYMRLLGRLNNFIVIDTSDRKKILHDLIATLKVNATDDQVANEISRFKNASLLPALLREQDIEEGSHIAATLCVYEAYQDYLQANNLVDFDDLLLLPFQILLNNPDVARDVSLRYRYI
ncbi:MAG: ATP-dependent helicase, partial [Helicobacter sp.]|nr:ATP-dependent helicase [Helicobacter sp.]